MALAEMAGVLGRAAGGSRRYDGPFGKSDRAAYFSILAVAAAVVALPGLAALAAIAAALALSAVTVVNRVAASLRETARWLILAAIPSRCSSRSPASTLSSRSRPSWSRSSHAARAARRNLLARTRTWWWIVVPVSLALIAGPVATAILFALISFVALREFLSIIPVRQVDRAAILIAYLAIPLQYWFVTDDWYGMFTIFIPVYVTAAIALRLVLAGETRGFIRSAGTLQWGLFLTVYN